MFASKIEDSEKTWLTNAFPSSLRQDVEEVIKMLPFNRNVLLADGKIHQVDNLIHSLMQSVYLNGELLKIPYRLYFDEPQGEKEKQLTALQRTILHCIYSRHHNGFVRQRHLEQLFNSNDYFVIPYTFQLLGEYVMEILTVLDKQVNDKTISNYVRFINENPTYWQQTESRMISYWNEYYRRQCPKLKGYIGKQIVDRIKTNAQHGIAKSGA
ncbi:hypothetical protein [Lacibacter sediminis]|uniref:Uncharacterized protein n=1 Tax=Lacibacter sediminis TaxID=2760713 RepID=A0A7G5XBT8_9BACT|nr:hypothetical protein [Lacibacter sediminis]QNA42941.1 hypothetical protein H4075_12660 [Lacibacter sediminis]